MKLVKEILYEKFTNESDPIKDMGIGLRYKIEEWIEKNKHRLIGCHINKDLTISAYKVDFYDKNLENFPDYIQFRTVKKNFTIQHNKFTTLRGCPYKVGGLFSCSQNRLTSLEYIPKKIVGDIYCYSNFKNFSETYIRSLCNLGGTIKV
jgi:hypothetical protein